MCLNNFKFDSSFNKTGPEPKPRLKGDSRTFRVFLDPNQYQQDMTHTIQNGTEDVYDTFNIIMRRKPKENNFKVGYTTASLYSNYCKGLRKKVI